MWGLCVGIHSTIVPITTNPNHIPLSLYIYTHICTYTYLSIYRIVNIYYKGLLTVNYTVPILVLVLILMVTPQELHQPMGLTLV